MKEIADLINRGSISNQRAREHNDSTNTQGTAELRHKDVLLSGQLVV